MGKILFVDLSRGELRDEALDEKLCRKFIGGYGIGARIIYSRQEAGVDPLGPENILGVMSGVLTGTAAPFASRFAVVVGKSPLTGTWGDANSGGDFGPYLKFAGYDGIFFMGISEKPVYLFIRDGEAEIRDASHLWGRDTIETEEILKTELGKEVRIVSIGPAGEKCSLISSIMGTHGRAAARSGVGAVMGSKKLKAVAVTGKARVPVANSKELSKLRKGYLAKVKGSLADQLRDIGTSGSTANAAHDGGSPVKNWGGVGVIDFPTANLIDGDRMKASLERRYTCYGCPIGCIGSMQAGVEYDYKAGTKRPEYETLAAFGTLCLNDNIESIIMANDICNRYGLDTISTGSTIAFAIECYENGIITKEDTEGINLKWGNHKAIVSMTEKLARREGFGAVLADGTKVAAEKIGKGADRYAIHVHGQEPGMWDPKSAPSYVCTYSDATPGRHTQHCLSIVEFGLTPLGLKLPVLDKYTYTGKGKLQVVIKNIMHLYQVSGLCTFSLFFLPYNAPDILISVVTGWRLSPEEATVIGERISAMRQAFNLREGVSPKDFKLPKRMIGDPPLEEGPIAKVTVDADTLVNEYYQAMGWDPETGKIDKEKLMELGLEDVVKEP